MTKVWIIKVPVKAQIMQIILGFVYLESNSHTEA